jgi:hypothetical protein
MNKYEVDFYFIKIRALDIIEAKSEEEAKQRFFDKSKDFLSGAIKFVQIVNIKEIKANEII